MDQKLDAIRSREDLAEYIRGLAEWHWKGTPEDSSLNEYLRYLALWVKDLDLERFYMRKGQPAPKDPDWRLFGHMLYAAGIYMEL